MDVAPLLSNLPHSWEDDPREPFLTFSYKHQKFGLYLPEIIQNVEVAVVLGATVLVAAAISLLIFKYILSPSTYRNSTLACCLLGYGIIVPFWILVPVYAVKILNIRNKVFRFVFGTVPTLSFFRTFEAMHGFCPPHTTESLASFALYYASPFIARYDANKKQYREATISTIIQKTTLYVRGLLLTGIIHSLFLAYPDAFIEIGSSFDRDQWYHWRTIFKWRRLWENLCFAVFFQTYLATCAFGLQLVTILVTGLDVEEMWINPLSESTSFSDFWGRRWNLSVHNALKRGVFKPARRYFPKCIALGATFLASGLFHEWIVWLVFSPLSNDEQRFNEDCDAWKCYTPTYSPAVVFFMFQGFLISIEFLMSQQQKKLLRDNIPGSIATLLIICIGGSLAHFFSDAYVHSSFYVGACVAYPVIKPINQYGG